MEEAKNKSGFFKRQFDVNISFLQMAYDIMFGAVLPLLCFYMDPFFLKDNDWFAIQYYQYVFFAMEIVALLLWLTFRKIPPALHSAFSGMFILGFVVSLPIGLLMLFYSFLFMSEFIDNWHNLIYILLGLIPIQTAFVYMRNAERTKKLLKGTISTLKKTAMILTGIIGVVLLQFAPPFIVEHQWDLAVSGNTNAAYIIKHISPILNEKYFASKYPEYSDNVGHLFKDVFNKEIKNSRNTID